MSVDITTRAGKGSPLEHAEGDANWLALKAAADFWQVEPIAFASVIPFTGTYNMPQTLVPGALNFTAAALPKEGASVWIPLVSNGVNIPGFPGTEINGSMGWDNRDRILNLVQLIYRGGAVRYCINQDVDAVPVPVPATGVTMIGPSGGVTGVASTNFTVGVTPVGGTITGSIVVTPSATGGGSFAPTSRTLTAGSPTGTFTYTPASTGAKTISVTNNGGLTNPANITYTSVAAATVPGAPTSVVATAGPAEIALTWATPGSNGGSALTGYRLVSSLGDSTVVGVVNAYTWTGRATSAQTVSIYSINAVGDSTTPGVSNSVTPTAVANVRLSPIVNITESGSGPYTYTSPGYSYGSTVMGGTFDKSFQSGVDGWASMEWTGTGSAIMFGLKTGSAVVLFGALTHAIYSGDASGNYVPWTAGTPGTATNVIAVAITDRLRLRMSGTSLIGEVSKNSGATWSTIYTWTGLSAAVRYIQATSGTAPGTMHTFGQSGLA